MNKVNTVYLIDDDGITNILHEIKIRNTGLNLAVRTFENAGSALSALFSADACSFPDVIFLDINMPVKDGWEFLDEYERLPQTVLAKCRVYLLSSSEDPNDIDRSKNYETVSGFLRKPLLSDKLDLILGKESTA